MKHFRLAALAAGVLAAAGPASAVVNPPVFKWQGPCGSFCQTGWYSSPAISDLDGDGAPEVIWGSYDLFVYQGSNGALRARAANAQRVWPGVAVADLTGDGSKEIVVGRGGNQVHVYRFVPPSTLQVVWSTAAAFPVSGEVRSLAVEDLESDGQLEVIVGRASSGADRQVNVFNANGGQRAGFPARRAGEEGAGAGMYNENLTVADLNGDGQKEIIAPTDTHYITALHPNGDQILTHPMYDHLGNPGPTPWARVGVHVDHSVDLVGFANCGTQHRPNFANSAPAIGDLDGDGTREIVVPGDVYNCGVGDPAGDLYHLPWILRRDRSRWAGSGFDWTVLPVAEPGSGPVSQDFSVIENSVQNAVLADLDSDGRMEILLPSYDGRLHAWWLDKTERHAWPFDVPGSGIRFASEPAVADLDDDGQAEVIFTSWGQKAGNTVGQLHIVSSQGVQLHAIDLPAASGVWNGGLGAPSLGNIDGDPDLEVVVGTSRTGVLAYDLPGTANARILWGTGRGNLQRTGALPAVPPAVSIADLAVAEGNQGPTAANLALTLTRASGVPVTVAYATGGGTATPGTDYTAATGVVTFPPGTTARTLTLAVTGDPMDEPNETFQVTLSAPAGATLGDGQSVVTIVDDDPTPVLRVSDCAVVEGNAGTTVCGLTVTLSSPSASGVTFILATSAGSATPGVDFVPVGPVSTQFPPGSTAVLVPVHVNGDTSVETDEAFALDISNVANATVADAQGTGTILDDDAPSPSDDELIHGWSQTGDLAQAPDVFRVQQAPYSSYEAIVDAVTGDAPAALLQRIASDNLTILQTGVAAGTGAARSLTWQNSLPGAVSNQSLRVGGTPCAPPCGADDVYRIRLYDTTYSIARFNNSATQATVLTVQNPTTAPVITRAMFWAADGTLLRLVESTIAPRGNFVLNASTVPELSGRSGSITVTSDAPYGALTGKAVALEPATGFSFDDVMRPRPR
ncbi:MAG: FG-GAP-like repeat-containing protein [Vicinamibacteria bacterium]